MSAGARVGLRAFGLLVAAAGVVRLGTFAWDEAATVRAERPRVELTQERYDCLRQLAAELTSPDQVLWIDDAPPTIHHLWRQRLWELAARERTVVADRSDADVILRIGPAEVGPGCEGYAVEAEAP